MAETEYCPISFSVAPYRNLLVSIGACPEGPKTTNNFFLTDVKVADWAIRSVEDPYEVTASMLQ
jgi:hypothetical protein